MIDLSFEYGCTPRELSQRLLQSDFVELQIYANKYQLPHRRSELLLAQIAQYIARTMGGAKAGPLQDYMPYREAQSADAVGGFQPDFEKMTPEQIRKYHNFNPDT